MAAGLRAESQPCLDQVPRAVPQDSARSSFWLEAQVRPLSLSCQVVSTNVLDMLDTNL